jgi:hypothetical protein
MEILKWLGQLIFYYEKDRSDGKPYWLDPAFMGFVVSIVATELAKYCGIQIDPALQLKIVGTITGIGVALSPQTGIRQGKVGPAPAVLKSAVHNLTTLSCFLFLFTFLIFVGPMSAIAAGSWTNTGTTHYVVAPGAPDTSFGYVEFTFVGDASTGSVPDLTVPATAKNMLTGWYLGKVEVKYMTTAPTSGWNVYLYDALDTTQDLLGGGTTSLTQTPGFYQAKSTLGNDYIPYDGRALTLHVTGNSVDSATATIRIYRAR